MLGRIRCGGAEESAAPLFFAKNNVSELFVLIMTA